MIQRKLFESGFFDNISQVSVLNQWISFQPFMPVILARINDLTQNPEINLTPPTISNLNIFGNYISAEVFWWLILYI